MPATLKEIGRIRRRSSSSDQYYKDKAVADKYADQMRGSIGSAAYDEAKRKLANHEWYVNNRQKKQKYNKEYYEKNREYWQDRYLSAKGKMDSLERKTWEYSDAITDSQRKGDLGGARQMREELDRTENQMNLMLPEERIAKENYLRAIREEQEFLKNNTKMPFTEAWSRGAKDIVAAGKSFISRLIGK